MRENMINTAPEWVCDSPEKADWAIEKIKECRERRDLYIAAAESRIAQLKDQIERSKEDCDSQTSYLMGALDSYLDEELYDFLCSFASRCTDISSPCAFRAKLFYVMEWLKQPPKE